MPRSAASRKFGYRSPAIVRILTAADPDEVLTALEILGISPERPKTLEQALEDVVLVAVEQVVGWVGPLNDLIGIVSGIDDIVQTFSIDEYELSTTSQIAALQERMRDQTNRVRAIAIANVERFKDLRDSFTNRMLAAKVKNPEVAWPPMPGIDRQL